MDFEERKKQKADQEKEVTSEKDIAKNIYAIKKDAFKITSGGVVKLVQDYCFICTDDPLGNAAVAVMANWVRHREVTLLFAWDADYPMSLANSPLDRCYCRLTLEFEDTKTGEKRQIAFWFDMIHSYNTLRRILENPRIIVFSGTPKGQNMPFDLNRLLSLNYFDVELTETAHSEIMEKALDFVQRYLKK